MSLFRDEAQGHAVAVSLAHALGIAPDLAYQTEAEPRVAWLVHLVVDGHRPLDAAAHELVAIGSLLVALGNGHDDVDEWIAMYTDDKEPR